MICASKGEKSKYWLEKSTEVALNNYDAMSKVPQKEKRLLLTDFEGNREKQENF